MGFILNRIDKLMELRNDSTINEQFKLTAIIAHDPKDENLKKHIKDYFLDFAKMTGKEFLFITFIQPPKEYVEAITSGAFKYAKLILSDSKQLSNTDTIINPLLRKYYGLPEKGSYLVLAKKLSDESCYKISISTASLPYQLMKLNSYCKRPYNFDELITELDGESINIKEMLGDSLLKIVALISPSSSPDKYGLYSCPQRDIALKTIVEEKNKLISLLKRSSDDEDLTDKVFNLYKIIANAYMTVLNEGQDHSNIIQKCKNYNLLDHNSKTFWNTYSRLCHYIEKKNRNELDYSAFILYLGKIVETELNLSICQMLRQSMGIAMPDFYNKYCYTKGKVYIPTSKQDIYLNKYIYNSENCNKTLEGVALGNLLHAYKTAAGLEISRHPNWHVLKPEKFKTINDDFLQIWEVISERRNDAAHARSVNADLYETALKLFNEFLDKYLMNFYVIKKNLRPGNTF